MHLHPSFAAASVLRSFALVAALAAAASPEARPEPAAPAPESACAPLFDCNGNGIEDAVDIAVGSSGDSNRNGVPDECESNCDARAWAP